MVLPWRCTSAFQNNGFCVLFCICLPQPSYCLRAKWNSQCTTWLLLGLSFFPRIQPWVSSSVSVPYSLPHITAVITRIAARSPTCFNEFSSGVISNHSSVLIFGNFVIHVDESSSILNLKFPRMAFLQWLYHLPS